MTYEELYKKEIIYLSRTMDNVTQEVREKIYNMVKESTTGVCIALDILDTSEEIELVYKRGYEDLIKRMTEERFLSSTK